MSDRYGASPEAWRYYSETLGLTADLLPVVSNPNAAISDRSRMKKLGKTPSVYNHERKAVGLVDWTDRSSTAADVEKWAREPDYGICIQTRHLKAIDVDVDDHVKAEAVQDLLASQFTSFTLRWRDGSGKFLVPFWHREPIRKHFIPVDGGLVEILGDGQQFVAEGMHESGRRYEWENGLEEAPVLDEIGFALLIAALKEIATGEIKVAGERRKVNHAASLLLIEDPVADWLWQNWETYDAGNDGQIFIACPFQHEHTADTGTSSTAYFPAGTGGYAEGNFVCLHAHCAGRSQAEFLNASGFTAGSFDDLGPAAPPRPPAPQDQGGVEPADRERSERQQLIAEERWPRLTRDAAGKIEATMNNLLEALNSTAMTQRHLGLDVFRDEIMWAPADTPRDEAQWRGWSDVEYAWVRQQLELRGFKPMGQEMLRLAVRAVATSQAFDSAKVWLGRLEWDGVQRVNGFAHRAWGWADNPYSTAVGNYVWSALAGRVFEPGIQADMVPILVGEQGKRKTSAIKAMAPGIEFYASLKLDAHDDDTSRLLRGVLVGELEELRGINSRAIEEIKAWVTKTHERWIPKFMEFATSYGRRCVLFGSTNDESCLGDATGERRWLPGLCAGPIDLEWIRENRDQLWAEGAVLFRAHGVDWKLAETLAALEHHKFKATDPWETIVATWLHTEDSLTTKPVDRPYLTTSEALIEAIGMRAAQIELRHQIRMASVLKSLGFTKDRTRAGFGKPTSVYIRD